MERTRKDPRKIVMGLVQVSRQRKHGGLDWRGGSKAAERGVDVTLLDDRVISESI